MPTAGYSSRVLAAHDRIAGGGSAPRRSSRWAVSAVRPLGPQGADGCCPKAVSERHDARAGVQDEACKESIVFSVLRPSRSADPAAEPDRSRPAAAPAATDTSMLS